MKTKIKKWWQENFFFLNVFLTSKTFFWTLPLLVSSVNLFEVYCKKKAENFFSFTKNGGVMRSGYTYREYLPRRLYYDM